MHHHPELILYQLGVTPYREAMVLQQQLHRAIVAQVHGPALLMLEHLPVITLGQHAQADGQLLASRGELAMAAAELVQSDRGGEITAHMPGQLVVYPLLKLATLALGVRAFIAALEGSVIDTLAGYGVVAERDSKFPGVWVGSDKICALGVRIKQRVSLHGLALNAVNDLSLFSSIVPCGIKGRGVTSLSRLLAAPVDMQELRQRLAENLCARLKVDSYRLGDKTSLELACSV